ncbi:MAG: hypothetical protein BWY15_00437 [Firmicutes bacterium ADurb.Bin193]|nr:MAG: hypothetical protein BWY15_00437 [Firmicutes bacterium ADurb.Bin193]
MKKYLGVKIVEAEPMNQRTFFETVKNQLYDSEISALGYKVVYPDGYVSWSPKDVFENAYRAIDGLTFGLALEALKQGKRVCRLGWNGKGMWLVLCDFKCDTIIMPEIRDSAQYKKLPWIGMKTANNEFVPWLASQTDMLADDWQIIE